MTNKETVDSLKIENFKLTTQITFLLHIVNRSHSYIKGHPLRPKGAEIGELKYLEEQWKIIKKEFTDDK